MDCFYIVCILHILRILHIFSALPLRNLIKVNQLNEGNKHLQN